MARGSKKNFASKLAADLPGRAVAFIATASLVLLVGLSTGHHSENPPRDFKKARLTMATDHYQVELKAAPKPKASQAKLVSPPPILGTWSAQVTPMVTSPETIPVIYKIITSEPVVFLTIDDGVTQSPEALAWLTEHKLPFTLFLDNYDIKDHYDYFRQLQAANMVIQNHTLNHVKLSRLSLEQQKAEICGAADTYAIQFGQRPTLLRPPYGLYNELTLQAAAACGMKAIIMWHSYVKAGVVHFQSESGHFEPGEIVLMHFRPEFLVDIQAFVTQAKQDNLQVGRLEDWIK